ncbi:two component transcriptional regulator, LuxR family [Eubacterium ruminantium]|nr:two component transcriptional regulator, LuxR family [Eubacterium ruminantium]
MAAVYLYDYKGMKNMNRVLLVDDEAMLLDSLEIILTFNNMEIAGKAHDGNEALELLKNISCDIALVDLNMKGMGGIELIRHMKELYPKIKILVLTTFYDDKNITDAISNGADGYLLKDSGKDAILGAIAQIMGGVTVLDQKVMQRLTSLFAGNMASGGSANTASDMQDGTGEAQDYSKNEIYGEFTLREKEIAGLMVEGLSNKQIADRLYISEGTVKNYISNIYDKTGIHDRVKLVVALKG